MNTSTARRTNWLSIILVILVALFAVFVLWNIVSTTPLGGLDFTGYWSSTYLLHAGQNPYSGELLSKVQRTQVHSTLDVTIMSWNPPTLFVFMLPLAWMPFPLAKFVWLLLNLALVVTAGLMLVRLYLPATGPRLQFVFLTFALIFPAVTTGLYMGQVTFLVFWGLVACMALIRKERWFWAGAVLILTTVKPHISALAMIYLLLCMAKHRKYAGWAGLAVAGLICLIILFAFRPGLLADFRGATAVAGANWATATIGGFLSYLGITEMARYLIVLLLPLPFVLIKYTDTLSLELAVALLTLLTVPTTLFGWSYDQAVLLIPIAQVFRWLAHSRYKIWISAGILCALLFNYYQRGLIINDTYYVWIPLFWWIMFGITWRTSAPLEKSYA